MLTTAKPIFENVPATFADPVGLADQQAEGVVALIVVRYAETEESLAVLGGVYDAFVCVSGQLLTVARNTPDYRFPVMPAVALRRFIEHRDAGRPAFLSVYELSETECARFIETVFYSECMKLMIGEASGDGQPSFHSGTHVPDAQLVADQLVRSGCGNGVLELNDFTDAKRPRLRLVDLHELSSSVGVVPDHSHPLIPGGTIDPAGLAAVLSGHMAGFVGRVLLYDRAKNKAVLPDKGGTPFDLMAAIREANRLAQARRGGDAAAALAQAETELRASAPPSSEQAEQVETYLKERAERPRAVEPSHPVATGLAALVLEMQGGPPVGSDPLPFFSPIEQSDDEPPVVDESSGAADRASGAEKPIESAEHIAPAPHVEPSAAAASLAPPEPEQAPGERFAPPTAAAHPAATPGADAAPHPHAAELETLRRGVYDLLADASGSDKAQALHAHALSELGVTGETVPPTHAVAYLRYLMVEKPPKRWMLFGRQRGKITPDVCGKLMAFASAHSASEDPCIEEASRLWARLHK